MGARNSSNSMRLTRETPRPRCKSQCSRVRKQHGRHAMRFANKFRHRKAQMLARRLRKQIKITKAAIEKNANHINLHVAKDRESDRTVDLLAKNRRVLRDVLRILITSLDGIVINSIPNAVD